jgi:hypothetical protein
MIRVYSASHWLGNMNVLFIIHIVGVGLELWVFPFWRLLDPVFSIFFVQAAAQWSWNTVWIFIPVGLSWVHGLSTLLLLLLLCSYHLLLSHLSHHRNLHLWILIVLLVTWHHGVSHLRHLRHGHCSPAGLLVLHFKVQDLLRNTSFNVLQTLDELCLFRFVKFFLLHHLSLSLSLRLSLGLGLSLSLGHHHRLHLALHLWVLVLLGHTVVHGHHLRILRIHVRILGHILAVLVILGHHLLHLRIGTKLWMHHAHRAWWQ